MRAPILPALPILLLGCRSTFEPEAAGSEAGALRMPPPTEHVLEDGAERDNKQLRKAYVRDRHLAAPGVDWKAIEREQAARRLERRNLLSFASTGVSRWTERGSRNQAGRTHVAVPSTDGSELYVGSSKGGVWRGDPNGGSWTPIGDSLYGGAHWLAVTSGASAGDPDVVLAATDGGSVHVSDDDGLTWVEPGGLPDLNGVRRVAQATDGGERVYLVSRRWVWTGVWEQHHAIHRSTDGGRNFTTVRELGTYGGDLFVPRDGGATLFAIDGTGLVRSTDHGASWVPVGAPSDLGSDAELVGSEAGAPTLYAVVSSGSGDALHRSIDGGATWANVHPVTDYWGTLSASALDPDLVIWGGVEAWRSTNGGQSFAKINGWGEYYGDPANKLHADLPGMNTWLDSAGGEVWYFCTDGGLYGSTDGGASVSNLSLDGLRISQYYDTLTSLSDPERVAAGSQDQGYQVSQPGTSSSDLYNFDQVISGDYGHLVSGNGEFDYVFSVYPTFILGQLGFASPQLAFIDFPSGSSPLWLPPLHEDLKNPENFFFCERFLWRYRKALGSNNWSPIQHSSQDFESTGGEKLAAVEFSSLDGDRAFAATTTGRLFHSEDRGVTWSQGTGVGPGSHYFYGTALLASSTDVDTVWVGGSGYSNDAVFRSTDGGLSFEPFGEGLPPTLVYCLAEASDGSGTLFCGTEQSAYRRDAGAPAWVEITGTDAPLTTYWSAETVPGASVVRFGTYGRGIFDYDFTEPCPVVPYGVALGGAHTLTLETSNAVQVGQSTAFEVGGAGPSLSGFLGVAAGEAAVPLVGGTLLLDPGSLLLFPFQSFPFGGALAVLAMPDNPALAGNDLYFQSFLIDGAQGQGVAFSNGLRATVCP